MTPSAVDIGRLPAIGRSASLSSKIVVCASRLSSGRAASARSRRLRSARSGRAATSTTAAPLSRAFAATTGAAPVPVPPPRAAVTTTMSNPSRTSESAPAHSRPAGPAAASRPLFAAPPRSSPSGFALPAQRPSRSAVPSDSSAHSFFRRNARRGERGVRQGRPCPGIPSLPTRLLGDHVLAPRGPDLRVQKLLAELVPERVELRGLLHQGFQARGRKLAQHPHRRFLDRRAVPCLRERLEAALDFGWHLQSKDARVRGKVVAFEELRKRFEDEFRGGLESAVSHKVVHAGGHLSGDPDALRHAHAVHRPIAPTCPTKPLAQQSVRAAPFEASRASHRVRLCLHS